MKSCSLLLELISIVSAASAVNYSTAGVSNQNPVSNDDLQPKNEDDKTLSKKKRNMKFIRNRPKSDYQLNPKGGQEGKLSKKQLKRNKAEEARRQRRLNKNDDSSSNNKPIEANATGGDASNTPKKTLKRLRFKKSRRQKGQNNNDANVNKPSEANATDEGDINDDDANINKLSGEEAQISLTDSDKENGDASNINKPSAELEQANDDATKDLKEKILNKEINLGDQNISEIDKEISDSNTINGDIVESSEDLRNPRPNEFTFSGDESEQFNDLSSLLKKLELFKTEENSNIIILQSEVAESVKDGDFSPNSRPQAPTDKNQLISSDNEEWSVNELDLNKFPVDYADNKPITTESLIDSNLTESQVGDKDLTTPLNNLNLNVSHYDNLDVEDEKHIDLLSDEKIKLKPSKSFTGVNSENEEQFYTVNETSSEQENSDVNQSRTSSCRKSVNSNDMNQLLNSQNSNGKLFSKSNNEDFDSEQYKKEHSLQQRAINDSEPIEMSNMLDFDILSKQDLLDKIRELQDENNKLKTTYSDNISALEKQILENNNFYKKKMTDFQNDIANTDLNVHQIQTKLIEQSVADRLKYEKELESLIKTAKELNAKDKDLGVFKDEILQLKLENSKLKSENEIGQRNTEVIEDLQFKLEKANNSYKNSIKTTEEYIALINELQLKLQTTTTSENVNLNELENINKALKEENEKLKTNLSDTLEKNPDLSQKLEQYNNLLKKCEDLEASNKLLREGLTKRKENYENAIKERNKLLEEQKAFYENQLKSFEFKENEYKLKIGEIETDLKNLQKSFKEREDYFNNIKNKTADEKSKIREKKLEETLTELNNIRNEFNKLKSAAEKEKNYILRENDELKIKIYVAERNNADHQRALGEINQNRESINNLRAENNRILENQQRDKNNDEERIRELQHRVECLDFNLRNYNVVKEQRDNLQIMNRGTIDNSKDLTKIIRRLSNRIDQLKAERDELEAKIDDSKDQLKDDKKKNSKKRDSETTSSFKKYWLLYTFLLLILCGSILFGITKLILSF